MMSVGALITCCFVMLPRYTSSFSTVLEYTRFGSVMTSCSCARSAGWPGARTKVMDPFGLERSSQTSRSSAGEVGGRAPG